MADDGWKIRASRMCGRDAAECRGTSNTQPSDAQPRRLSGFDARSRFIGVGRWLLDVFFIRQCEVLTQRRHGFHLPLRRVRKKTVKTVALLIPSLSSLPVFAALDTNRIQQLTGLKGALKPKATQRSPSPAGCGLDGCESAARTISPRWCGVEW